MKPLPSFTHGFLFLGLLGITACKKPALQQAPPPIVTFIETKKTDVERSTVFVGQLDSPQNVEIRARVESFLDKVAFTEGEEVKKGDLLFMLDEKPYLKKIASAKGDLAAAQAALTRSNIDVPRLTSLVSEGAAPQRDLDNAIASQSSNKAKVASAEAALEAAQLELSYCEIHAPLSGRIGAKQASVGSLVGKGEPTLLATISQVDPMWFDCSISEVDFIRADKVARKAGYKLGQLPLTLILPDGSESESPGKWVFKDRVVDPTTATIRARAEFANPTGVLRPGMFARVRVSLPSRKGNILVPDRALTELQGKEFLWILQSDNTVKQRMVNVAETRIGSNVMVLSGVEAGEKVIVEGIQKVRDGSKVTPKPFAPPGPDSQPPSASKPPGKPKTDQNIDQNAEKDKAGSSATESAPAAEQPTP
ncbi:efflux RND transporter periplasmic adaptor subunit [Verrucomicrobiaceae bacterium N1E253]|uniref:Efflux RND transporter periplasmic adaptor subunit n=1 Tax=Oceaniferula marina TaxID=2748318 RepID=A0A851GRC8_9BACT|nr:efflux RND transporter periplasmic adaptor subunit [Oceaniferula marina]NWK57557.1 efflux RND transporter periplasmic adaptor subunit [Oceaniferula marina]